MNVNLGNAGGDAGGDRAEREEVDMDLQVDAFGTMAEQQGPVSRVLNRRWRRRERAVERRGLAMLVLNKLEAVVTYLRVQEARAKGGQVSIEKSSGYELGVAWNELVSAHGSDTWPGVEMEHMDGPQTPSATSSDDEGPDDQGDPAPGPDDGQGQDVVQGQNALQGQDAQG